MPSVGTEAEQEAERASLQAYFHVDESKDGHICVHASALPTILYHYEDTLAEESENSTKGRHAPTRQAGLSELLCVVGRLLLRKVLTSYQSSLEEEQNQQLLVRLVLSYFQAQALERQAAANMESLIEEDSTPSKSGASKRKLKKDRRLKRQEAEMADETNPLSGEVTWDEDQELSLLTQMGWSKCMGSTCTCTGASSASSEGGSAAAEGGAGAESPVEAAVQLALDASVELGSEAAEAARLKLQLSTEEWMLWEQRKEDLLEERQRIREQLKQRFEEFCERNGVGPWSGGYGSSSKGAKTVGGLRAAAAY